MSTAGTTGVRRVGCTFASRDAKGRLLSRAIANIIRMVAVCTARQHTVIATTIEARKTLPSSGPAACRSTCCSPPLLEASCGSARSSTAISPKSRISPPSTNDATTARTIARGAVRRGSTVSSPSELAVSNPYMTYPDASAATRKAPRYPRGCPCPVPAVVVSTSCGPRLAASARTAMISTAATSSTKTPVLLIRDINRTPKTLTRVVNRMSALPRTTALIAKSYSPLPSPTTWKPDHSWGSVIW